MVKLVSSQAVELFVLPSCNMSAQVFIEHLEPTKNCGRYIHGVESEGKMTSCAAKVLRLTSTKRNALIAHRHTLGYKDVNIRWPSHLQIKCENNLKQQVHCQYILLVSVPDFTLSCRAKPKSILHYIIFTWMHLLKDINSTLGWRTCWPTLQHQAIPANYTQEKTGECNHMATPNQSQWSNNIIFGLHRQEKYYSNFWNTELLRPQTSSHALNWAETN